MADGRGVKKKEGADVSGKLRKNFWIDTSRTWVMALFEAVFHVCCLHFRPVSVVLRSVTGSTDCSFESCCLCICVHAWVSAERTSISSWLLLIYALVLPAGSDRCTCMETRTHTFISLLLDRFQRGLKATCNSNWWLTNSLNVQKTDQMTGRWIYCLSCMCETEVRSVWSKTAFTDFMLVILLPHITISKWPNHNVECQWSI